MRGAELSFEDFNSLIQLDPSVRATALSQSRRVTDTASRGVSRQDCIAAATTTCIFDACIERFSAFKVGCSCCYSVSAHVVPRQVPLWSSLTSVPRDLVQQMATKAELFVVRPARATYRTLRAPQLVACHLAGAQAEPGATVAVEGEPATAFVTVFHGDVDCLVAGRGSQGQLVVTSEVWPPSALRARDAGLPRVPDPSGRWHSSICWLATPRGRPHGLCPTRFFCAFERVRPACVHAGRLP